jgi:hypothetical protein
MASGHDKRRSNRPDTRLHLTRNRNASKNPCNAGANGMDPALAAMWNLER